MHKKLLFLTLTCCLSMHAMEKKEAPPIISAAQATDQAVLGVKDPLTKSNDSKISLIDILKKDAEEPRTFENTRRVLGIGAAFGIGGGIVGACVGGLAGATIGIAPAFYYRNPWIIAKGAKIGALGLGCFGGLGTFIGASSLAQKKNKLEETLGRIGKNFIFLDQEKNIQGTTDKLYKYLLFSKRAGIDDKTSQDNVRWLGERKNELQSQLNEDIAIRLKSASAIDKNGWNLLHHAAFAGDKKTVQKILEDIDFNIHKKCRVGCLPEKSRYYAQAKTSPSVTAFELAQRAGHVEVAEMIDAKIKEENERYSRAVSAVVGNYLMSSFIVRRQ